MLIAMPVTLLALVVAGAPWNQPAPEGVRSPRSALHATLSEPSAWRLPEPEILRISSPVSFSRNSRSVTCPANDVRWSMTPY